MFLGFYLALGFLYFSDPVQKILRPLCQLAFILPSIFTILICFQFMNPFPYGHIGVICIFSVVHLGFSTIYIANCLQARIKNMGLISKIYNLNRMTFFRRIVLPLICKDLAVLGLIIFLSCISSLAIPLVAGAGHATNLELYIFEKIFIEQKWNEAVILSVIQSAILFLITWSVFKKNGFVANQKTQFFNFSLSSVFSAACLVALITVYICAYLYKTAIVLIAADLNTLFDSEFAAAFLNSMITFSGLIVLFLFFLVVVIYSIYKKKHPQWINLFLSPSTILVGFGLYLLLPANQSGTDFFKMSFGLFILFSVGLYQTYLSPQLSELKSQLIVCRIYNLDLKIVIKNMIWPQMQKNIIFVVSLLFLLSLTEFSLLKATGSQKQTVGTLTFQYLNSYRMDQAYVISFTCLISWLIFYALLLFLTRVKHVRD